MFYWSDHFPKKYWFWLTLWWKRLELYLRKNMTLFEEIQGIQLLFLESLQQQLSDARTKGGFSVEISFTKIKFPIETLFEAKKRLSSRGTGFPLTKGLEIKKKQFGFIGLSDVGTKTRCFSSERTLTRLKLSVEALSWDMNTIATEQN